MENNGYADDRLIGPGTRILRTAVKEKTVGHKNHDFLVDIPFTTPSNLIDFDHVGFSKSQYGQILMQFIHDEMHELLLFIKQNFEANYDLISKAHISTAYGTLSRLITELRTDSSLLFLPVCTTEITSGKLRTENTLQHTEKKSFLVFKNNKYFSVQVNQIAFFYVKNNCSTIMTLNEQEYPLDQSLDRIQSSLLPKQFFRLNRQYLINFNAIKEIEHYFSRKLFVKLVIPSPEILLVGKERATCFLNWMSQR